MDRRGPIEKALDGDSCPSCAALRAEVSDAWSLAYNLDPDRTEPSELDLCGQINHLGEHIAALRTRVEVLEERDEVWREKKRVLENDLGAAWNKIALLEKAVEAAREYQLAHGPWKPSEDEPWKKLTSALAALKEGK